MDPRRQPIGPSARLLASFFLVSASASGFVDEIAIDPPWPSEDDFIVVRISGSLPTPCWSILGTFIARDSEKILIAIDAERTWDGPCIQIIQPYSLDLELGKLPAGRYRLVVEDAQTSMEIEFQVTGSRQDLQAGSFVCDPNQDGETDLADAVFFLMYFYAGGPAPACPKQSDANGDSTLDLSDVLHLLTYLFLEGPPPAGTSDCYLAEDCAGKDWLVDCLGHWTCDCGECRPVCDFQSCGDGRCDVVGGETPHSCPTDCTPTSCKPICDKIGTRSEGWYDSCTGKLIRWAFCKDCEPQCKACGSKSEGWYDSCSGNLIIWGDCDCQ